MIQPCNRKVMVVCIGMDEQAWLYFMVFLAIVPWFLLLVVLVCYSVSIFYGRFKLHHKSTLTDCNDGMPGVSIIKPLSGLDDSLHSNLETHFKLHYPKLELLFCLEDTNDPALALVYNMQNKYPNVPSRIFIGGKNGILNPLVNNMTPAYEACKYDLVWISTSRVKVNTEILVDMVGKICSPSVALVHQMPFTADQKGIAAAIEKVYFGTVIPRYYFMSQVFNICCFTGMSYLVKKSELDLINGLPWYGRYLAEDYFMAKTLHARGFRHKLSAIPAQQNVARCTISSYKERMVRWQKLRINMLPFITGAMEPLGESIPLTMYLTWSLWYSFNFNPFICILIILSIWCLLDYVQLKGVQNGPLPFNTAMFIVAWVMRQVLYLFIYFEAVMNWKKVKWGAKVYQVSNYGKCLHLVTRKRVRLL